MSRVLKNEETRSGCIVLTDTDPRMSLACSRNSKKVRVARARIQSRETAYPEPSY